MNLTLKKVSKLEEFLFLQQMVTIPRNSPWSGIFCFLGEKRRGWGRLLQSGMEYFGYDNLRVVMVSGSFSYFEFRSADRIASSDDDTATRVTSHLVTSIENLQCLSVDFVLLLNTKIHHVYSG